MSRRSWRKLPVAGEARGATVGPAGAALAHSLIRKSVQERRNTALPPACWGQRSDRRRRPPRIVLYSHDTVGLGHVRRNVLLSGALARPPMNANVILISGVAIARAFSLPEGVDCVTLPALYKEPDGGYRSRSLRVSLDDIIALRATLIHSAVRAFRPDMLIVDCVPRGVEGELDKTLADPRIARHTAFVLGLRDVLDDPATIRREWQTRSNEAFISRYYDAVWVYGDRSIYDLVEEYGFSNSVGSKILYTGYLERAHSVSVGAIDNGRTITEPHRPAGQVVLCMSGGGQDGAALCEAFAEVGFPDETSGLILTGPFMPPAQREALHAHLAANTRLRILDFHPEPLSLMQQACAVVAMGGYNTVCEVVSLRKKALIVPRVTPRSEQLIRALRLAKYGFVDVCHPSDLSPATISTWIRGNGRVPPPPYHAIDFSGLVRVPELGESAIATKRGHAVRTYQA